MTSFPSLSCGWAFPGEDDLHRPLGMVQDLGQTGRVFQDQVSPLVGGKPSGESDGQRLRVQHLAGGLNLFFLTAPPPDLLLQPLAGEGDQPLPPAFMGPPEFGVGNPFDPRPHGDIIRVFGPPPAEVAVKKPGHVIGDVGGDVDPVGHALDGNILFRQVRPYLLPHPAGYGPVELAHPVGLGRALQGHDGHVEGSLGAVLIGGSRGPGTIPARGSGSAR